MAKTLVTGATGTIGSQLTPRLCEAGVQTRALVRDRRKAAPLEAAGAELVVGEFEQGDTLKDALDDVETLVLITPATPNALDQAASTLERARRAGVRRVVRLSVIKASEEGPTENVRQHGATDSRIQASDFAWTLLRPNFFMQNLFMSVSDIRNEGAMYWGMGSGRIGMIDARDIADAAFFATVRPGHEQRIYELTGPDSISLHDVAAALGEALGRSLEYVPVPPESVEQTLQSMGMGAWFARVMRDYSAAYGEGWGDFTTDAVRRATGHEPRSIHAFAREVFAPALES